MITKFKLFENKKFIFDNHSYWVIYGSKTNCINLLITLKNDYDLSHNLRYSIDKIVNQLENYKFSGRFNNAIGIFLKKHNDSSLSLSIYFFTSEEHKREIMKSEIFIDDKYNGELKLNSFGSVKIDTTDADLIKYNL